MTATWRFALLEVFAFLWILSGTDAIGEANTTTVSPFTTLNGTVSSAESSNSVAAVIGRVAVGLCVATAVGVILYCLKKKCPRGSSDGERQRVVRRRHSNGESRPLNGDIRPSTSQSSLSVPPLFQPHNSNHTE